MFKHAAYTVRCLVRNYSGQIGRVLIHALFQIECEHDDSLLAVGQVVCLCDAFIQCGCFHGNAVVQQDLLKRLVGETQFNLRREVAAVDVVIPPVLRHQQSLRLFLSYTAGL